MITLVIIVLGAIAFISFCIVGHLQARRDFEKVKLNRANWDIEETFRQAERERNVRALEIADVDNMAGISFEHYVQKLLTHQGYTAKVTQASNDLGTDIIAERDGIKYSIQVKRQEKPVSRRAISDALGGRDYYCCDRAMVITNSHFTEGAIKMASSTKCVLVNREILARWIVDFQQPASDVA